MMTDEERKASRKRSKKAYRSKVKRLVIDFYPSEPELLEHVEKQPQKRTYIKDLIRADIANQAKALPSQVDIE